MGTVIATPGLLVGITRRVYKRGMTTLADRIRIARERKGWTQIALAQQIGIASQTVNMYEHGRKLPGRANLQRLAEALGVTTDWLLAVTNLSEQLGNDNLGLSDEGGRLVPKLDVADAVQRRAASKTAARIYAHFPCSEKAYWFEMPDESMEPTYPKGSRMVWDPTRKPRPGSVVLGIAGPEGSPIFGELSYAISPHGKVTVITPRNGKWAPYRSDLEMVEVIATLSEGTIRST